MSKVAMEAGISKSLLFYYFKNKKEYYFFILNQVINDLNAHLSEIINEEKSYDLFGKVIEIIELKQNYYEGLQLYYELFKRTYYERDEDLLDELQSVKKKLMQPYEKLLKSIDKNKFKDINEVTNCFKILLYCAEGLLSNIKLDDIVNWDILVNEYMCIIHSLKQHYYKEVN